MERTKPQQIGELVENLIKQYRLDRPMAAHKACMLWGQIVGPGINRYTTKRYVADGVLNVWISSAALKNELSFMRPSIIEAINKELGENAISEIRIH